MRLTAIKLAGFKSFVDPVTLPLPTNLTAVVGPNGSGKSNLIDAVRWVLGESSAKALRGADSQDVIFNGASSRKPAGKASVELRFDNSDQSLQGPWGRYSEIVVRREVVRSEGSRYLINGQKCLKRDVVDLFLGTGLGGRNQYAILEQGTVSQLVEAKPEELRRWLEEAAGISRYKEKRRETEFRIKQTRENLSRLADLQSEVENRLKLLAKQAADAEKYNQGKQQERRLKAELLILRRRALAKAAAGAEHKLTAAQTRLAAVRKAVTDANVAREDAEKARLLAAEAFNTVQADVYEVQARVASEEQKLVHAREMQNLHAREASDAETRLKQLQARTVQATETLSSRERDLQEHQSECDKKQEQISTTAQELEEAERVLQVQRQRWSEHEQRAQTPMLEAERERARVQALDTALSGLSQRRSRLEQEKETLNEAPLQASLLEADRELEELVRVIETAHVEVDARSTELKILRETRLKNEEALHEARHLLETLRGRVASLETLQQAALHADNEALDEWMAERGWNKQPRLADVLRVDNGWETAVEHALAGLLQAPVMPDWNTAALPDSGPQDGMSAIAGDGPEEFAHGGTLAARVAGPPVVREWLSRIHVADTASAAVAVISQLPPTGSVMTREGVWWGQGWVRYPSHSAADAGVIVRGQMLRDSETAARDAAQKVRSLEDVEQSCRQQLQTGEEQRRIAAERLDQARDKRGSIMGQRQAREVRLDQTRSRLGVVAGELETLEAERRDTSASLGEARKRLSTLEETVEKLHAERTRLRQTLQQAQQGATQARQAHDAAVAADNAARIQVAQQHSALQAAKTALADLGEQSTAIEQTLGQLRDKRAQAEAPVREHEAEAGQARQTLHSANEALRGRREQVVASEAQVKQAQHALQETENQRDQVLEAVQEQRVALEGQRSRKQALEAQITESGQDLGTLESELAADAEIEKWEQQLDRVSRRIERLGAINLAAIPELEETRERSNYLDGQRQDLEDALATLEAAMVKLDRETRDMFRGTFERVDDRFRQCCPLLFGGGRASLERTDDDWLTSGVRIMVQPPGKRNAAIQLLSGGEKAMSAVALLFALFELNPAPFCLLDEVEAPLDEANVRRFSDLVRNMSTNVQFVIITHNKVTMELAEHLHGVTMQEPGVSRLVSVDVREAERLAEPDAVTATVEV